MTIAITGATGQLGRLVVASLKNKTKDFVALARSADKAKELGVPVRIADYEKPDTLKSALAGIDTMLLISASEIGKREAQHANVLSAAKQNGVKRIVYTSILHADTSTIGLAAEHRATEAAIKASGTPYTFLRNGWYNENYVGSMPGWLAAGAVIGSAGAGKISAAARSDYADAAVTVLTTPGHDGKVYELAGDEAFTLADLARELARASGKAVAYKDLPAPEYAAALAGFGLPQWLATTIADWDVQAAKGALFDGSRQLSKLIGHPTTPMAQTVTATVRAMQAA